MYKIINLTKFRPGVAREDVLAWWRGPHADLAKATPGMLRYVQSYWSSGLDPATGLATGRPGGFDGHAEHWFADQQSYEAAMASPEWKATLEDGPKGFQESLIGAALEETVICWDPMDDGRESP